jgi:hypothetical protein
MMKLMTAIALTIALPAVAHAADPAPQPKQDCCEKMKAESKKCCCDEMADKGHAGHGEHGSHSAGHEGHQR